MKYDKKLDLKGKAIGEGRVKRALKELGLLKKPVVRKVRTTNSEHSLPRFENLILDRAATYPDEIWASDITYISIGSGHVYLAVILDLFTRCIRGWHLSRSLEGDLTMIALKKAFDAEGAKESGTGCATPNRPGRCPTIHHSDQGGQYAATAYVNLLKSKGVLISMASVGCPEENGYAERWMRTLKENHVQMSEYSDFWDAQAQIGTFNDYSSDASVGVSTELSNKSTAPPDYSHQTRHKSEMLQEGTAILRKHIQLPNEERFKLGFTTLIGNIITNHIFIRITTNRTNEKAT